MKMLLQYTIGSFFITLFIYSFTIHALPGVRSGLLRKTFASYLLPRVAQKNHTQYRSFSSLKHVLHKKKWISRVILTAAGTALTGSSLATAYAYHVSNLPARERYKAVLSFLDHDVVQKIFNWLPAWCSCKLAAYWKSDGTINSLKDYLKESRDQELLQLRQEVVQKWPQGSLDGVRTATESHLLIEGGSLELMLEQFFRNHRYKKELIQLMQRALQSEKKALKHHKITVWHACSKDIYFMQYMDKKILEYVSGRSSAIPIALRGRKRSSTYVLHGIKGSANYKPFQGVSALDKRLNYLKKGVTVNDHKEQHYLISINIALAGNVRNWYRGESSLERLLKNNSSSPPRTSAKNEEVEEFYKKHNKEIDVLHNYLLQDREDRESGILLQINMSEELFKKSIYFAKPLGRKVESTTIDLKEEKDALRVVHAVRNKPFVLEQYSLDSLQARLVITKDLWKDPFNKEVNQNAEIIAYSLYPEKLQEFHRRVDTFFENIKQKESISTIS